MPVASAGNYPGMATRVAAEELHSHVVEAMPQTVVPTLVLVLVLALALVLVLVPVHPTAQGTAWLSSLCAVPLAASHRRESRL